MRKLALLLLLCPLMMMAENKKVSSPDGRLAVDVKVENGKAMYAVQYDGVEMLQSSRLGFEANIGDFKEGLTFVGATEGVMESSYDLSRSKVSHVDFKANRLDVTLANAKGQRIVVKYLAFFHMSIIFQWQR